METSSQQETTANNNHVLVECKISRRLTTAVRPDRLASDLMDALPARINRRFQPVPIKPSKGQLKKMEEDGEDNIHFLFSAEADASEIEQLKSHPDVVDVWSDAEVEQTDAPDQWCPGDDTRNPDRPRHFGTLEEIIDLLDVARLLPGRPDETPPRDGRILTGNNIVVGVVDGGITATGRATVAPALGTVDGVIGGWTPEGAEAWGTASYGINDHGNAMATLVKAVAPRCDLLDMRIWNGPVLHAPTRTSNAIQAYRWAIETYLNGYEDETQHLHRGTPHILTNSWAVFWRGTLRDDYPRNMDHPFTRMVVEAIDTGIMVVFCAGNCGAACTSTDSRCGSDVGPGRSIWGAASHPRVMTVGAVTKYGTYVGYSSQGPASIFYGSRIPREFYNVPKPDFCCYTAFSGAYYGTTSTPNSGTSSSTALVAGVLALLKQARPGATQDEVMEVLKETAQRSGSGRSADPMHVGVGYIRPLPALRALTDRVREREMHPHA